MKKQEVKAIIRFVLAVWILLVFGIARRSTSPAWYSP